MAVTVAGLLAACVGTPAGPSSPVLATSAATPAGEPVTSAAPSFVRPTATPRPTFLVHEVRAGESLNSIARLYGTTARSIAYWNRDQYRSLDPDSTEYEPDRIVVGWLLRVIPTDVVDEDELPDPTPTRSEVPAATAGSG